MNILHIEVFVWFILSEKMKKLKQQWKTVFSSSGVQKELDDIDDNELVLVMSKISPIIRAKVDPAMPKEKKLCIIRESASRLLGRNMPSETVAFLKIVSENYRIFCPESPIDCIPFVMNFCPEAPGDFFTFELTRCLGDPALVVGVYAYLQKTRNPLWERYTRDGGACARIFDMLAPFMVSDKCAQNVWNTRLEIFYLLVSLIKEKEQSIPMSNEVVLYFHKAIKRMVEKAPSNVAVNVLRYGFDIEIIGFRMVKPEIASKRLKELLFALPKDSPCYEILIMLALNNAPLIKKSWIVNFLINQEQATIFNMKVLANLAINSNMQLSIVQYLSRIMILDAVYGRIASCLLRNVISNNHNDCIRKWIIDLVKGFAIFIVLALQRKKYNRRINRVIECLINDICHCNEWTNDVIYNTFSGLVNIKKAPLYFKQIFISSYNLSDDFINSFDKYNEEVISLKCFPFVPSENILFEIKK